MTPDPAPPQSSRHHRKGPSVAAPFVSSLCRQAPTGASTTRAYAAPPRVCHRSRKKWWPQRAHRHGISSQRNALSNPFRTPTPLNSIDLQWGHRVEISPLREFSMSLGTTVFRITRRALDPICGRLRRVMWHRFIASRGRRPAHLFRRPDLLRCSQVRLRSLCPVFRPCNLALVTFHESLRHSPSCSSSVQIIASVVSIREAMDAAF